MSKIVLKRFVCSDDNDAPMCGFEVAESTGDVGTVKPGDFLLDIDVERLSTSGHVVVINQYELADPY